MPKIPRQTNCCNYQWDGEDKNNPLALKPWGAECSKCKAAYILDANPECNNCGCTEMLCGAFGTGCVRENE